MKTILIVTLFVFLMASPLWAQQPTLRDPLLDHLTGNWILRGQLAGKETVHDVTAAWVLNHQFVRIHEVSREKNTSGQPEYQADVYVGWNQASKEYGCVWLDVWGSVTPQSIGRAKPGGDEIPFLFRDKNDKVVFHTTFIYNKASDTWQWVMDNDEAGKLEPFARLKLTRK